MPRSKPYAGLPGLKDVCKQHGYTVARFARLLDRDPAAFAAIVRGDKPCTPQLYALLCNTLRCTLPDLQPFYHLKGGSAAPPAP